jgi:hypothetical protein
VKGRKRTILVDTMGLLLAACVHGAGRSDQRIANFVWGMAMGDRTLS